MRGKSLKSRKDTNWVTNKVLEGKRWATLRCDVPTFLSFVVSTLVFSRTVLLELNDYGVVATINDKSLDPILKNACMRII